MTSFFFFFNDTATTEIYTLSLHDALPISCAFTRVPGRSSSVPRTATSSPSCTSPKTSVSFPSTSPVLTLRSEEHTSELQSQSNLVCRLLLEKKNRRSSASSSCTADLEEHI